MGGPVRMIVLALLFTTAGCELVVNFDRSLIVDAGPDAGAVTDGGVDAGSDGGVDAGVDAGADSGTP